MKTVLITRIALALTCLLLSAVSVSAQATDPISVIKASQEAISAGNVEAALATFADDAVFTVPTGSFRGKEQIRTAVATDAANHIRIEASNFQVDGDKVTWSFKRSDDGFRKLGLDFITGSGEAIVQGGKIKSLTSTPSAESRARIQAAQAAAQAQQTLPKTGGTEAPEAIWVLGFGVVLMSGLGLILMRIARRV